MTRLSVNINKVALLRNSRGGNIPDVIQVAMDCERFGAHGITVHPRPDERHIRYADVIALKDVVKGEFNVEGYPSEKFIRLIKKVKPHQVTLVPDPPDALTSSEGWDTIRHQHFLRQVIADIKQFGIRVSLFIDPIAQFLEGAAMAEADRIEFYTGPYASNYPHDPEQAITKYVKAAKFCASLGLEINAGHDLNLHNLGFLIQKIPQIKEVSIGHALIADALYYGLQNTIGMYLQRLQQKDTSGKS
ncbi:MAG: pyridoxine 5'-phosphate synthase [Chitinophagales bacterium]|nr:MAG: pyridoxine 5'-phosphate synthase [Chitinophagales bacterium]